MSETYSKYSVPPWSRRPDSYYATGLTGDLPECAICGRVITSVTMHHAIVINGGADWGDEYSDESDAGYMGCFDVGPDCHRRFVVKAAKGASR